MQTGLGLPRYDRLAVPRGAACIARHFSTYREEEGVTEQLRISPLQLETQQQEDMQDVIACPGQ